MADSQRKTANLFDKDNALVYNAYFDDNDRWYLTPEAKSVKIPCNPNTTYTMSIPNSIPIFRIYSNSNTDVEPTEIGTLCSKIVRTGNISQYTFTTSSTDNVIIFQGSYSAFDGWFNGLMLNEGSTPLPYEPYGWVHSLRKLGTATDTLTTLPAEVYADGQSATVGLVGNMEQTGTPSPSSPIQPQECGERTGNLFDVYQNSQGVKDTTANNVRFQYINQSIVLSQTSNGTYPQQQIWGENGVLKLDVKAYYCQLFVENAPENANIYVLVQASNDNFQTYTTVVTISAVGRTFTPSGDFAAYRYVFVCQGNGITYNNTTVRISIVEGSTAPSSYEPYGYKIPILSNSTTTNVYLGEVQSTRRIKKLVLTGNEPVYSTSASTSEQGTTLFVYTYSNLSMNDIINEGAPMGQIDYPQFLSNSFIMKTERLTDWKNTNNGELSAQSSNSGNNNFVIFGSNQYSTTEDFKAYLQQRYASGNPVTIYYILATPQTAVVNEPIRKIGDYADTVSGITIPTISGKDSFDVLTTLKPSEVDLTYTGWHDASAKEWDGSEWQDEQPVSLLSTSSRPTLTESTPDIMDITEPEEKE